MKYQNAKTHLEKIFRKNDFGKSLSLEQFNSKYVELEKCENGSIVSISFPGYKAKSIGNKINYDYRIDLLRNGNETSLSHSNILVDIYNKTLNGKMDTLVFQQIIIQLSQTGTFNIEKIREQLRYTPTHPPTKLLQLVKQYHGSKYYNELGNKVDLDLEELLLSIKWIVIQEDINYPISKGFEGRKMCFSRYLECIHLAQNQRSHSLEELIKRTLSHSRPNLWSDMDYRFLKKIV